MSLRRVDARFCLPEAPRSAIVLDGVEGWSEGLEQTGIELRRSGPADLVVAPSSSAADALEVGARAVLLEGRGGRRRLARAGTGASSLLVRPRTDRPELVISLAARRAAAYAIRHWTASYTRGKRARNLVARALVGSGLMPEVDPVVAIGAEKNTSALPYVVRAARPFGVPDDAGWFMTCGQGDVLSRNVFQLFRRHAAEPDWVLKFARLPGHDDAFRRDAHGLGLAERGGATVAEHAPRLLGRFEVGGLAASLETAATGTRLRAALLAPGAERRKLALIADVADWLLAVARTTAAPPEALQPELERLEAEVLPLWRAQGAPSDLVQTLPPLPAVLQHNDVGCWNVVVGNSGFVVVDWESAREHGLPLWDLVYFLTDALATVDKAPTPEEQDEHSLRLLRGESSRSPLFFGFVARAARDLDLPRAAVGPIVTLGWLHHGLSPHTRAGAVGRAGDGELGLPAPGSRLAARWLSDPALGPLWKAWRDL